MLKELEAMLFFQKEVHLFEQGQAQVCDELTHYLNEWMIYFNELTAEQQQEKMDFIMLVDHCSQLSNAVLDSMA